MSQKFFNIGRVLIIIAAIGLIFGVLNFMGIIDVKSLTIQGLSVIPGLNDLAENYELGKKRSALLSKRERDIKAREERLTRGQTELEQEKDQFLGEKMVWERKNRVTAKTTTASSMNASQKAALAKEEAKVKQYLAMIGSMKPKKAAMVIQKLPEDTVFMIFDQLQKSQVTKILENMPEEYLAKLTQDRLDKYRNF